MCMLMSATNKMTGEDWELRGGRSTILNNADRERCPEKTIFQQRPEGGERESHVDFCGRTFPGSDNGKSKGLAWGDLWGQSVMIAERVFNDETV